MKTIKLFLSLMLIINICSAQKWENANPGGGGWFMKIGAGPTGVIVACSDVSGAYRSLDRGKSWEQIGSFAGLQTHCLGVGFDPINPAIVFVGSESALYRSNDTAKTFAKVVDYGVWTDIDISLSNPNICYASYHPMWNGREGAIFKSTDNGITWAKVSTGLANDIRIGKVMVHPTKPDIVYFVSGKSRFVNGVEEFYKSIDGGVTWIQIGESLGAISDAVFDPSDSRKLYVVVTGKGVFKSSDDGSTWSSVPQTNAEGRIFINRNNPLVLRIINDQGVMETLDGGTTWMQKSLKNNWDQGFIPCWNFEIMNGILGSIDEDLSDPDAYYWVTSMWVYGSFDGGTFFGPLHTNETEKGSNWWTGTGINNTEVFDCAISPADPKKIYISLWDMGLWRSMDRGITWQSCNKVAFTGTWYGKGGDSWTVLADPTRPEVVWAGLGQRDNSGYLVKSTAAGEISSWVNSGTGLPGPKNIEIWGLSLDPSSPENMRTLFVTAGGNVFKSVDDGANWKQVLSNTISKCRATSVDNVCSKIVWAAGDSRILVSQDGGETWKKVGIAGMNETFDIKTHPKNKGWVYAACFGSVGGIFRSKDIGETWEKIWAGPYMRGIAIDPVNPDYIYATSSRNYCCGAPATGSTGVIRTTDGGLTWNEVNEGLSSPFAFPIEIDPKDNSFVFMGSPGNGFYKRTFTDVTPYEPSTPSFDCTGVDVGETGYEESIHIFPNPTNDLLTLSEKVIMNSNYSVEVFDLQGKLIMSFTDEPKTIDVSHLFNGVYFVSIKGDNLTINEKFVKE